MIPVTLAVIEHEAPEARLPPLQLMTDEPAAAVTVPSQVVDSPLGVATTRPAGKLSVNPTPVSVVDVLGLLMEKFRAVVSPVKMGFSPKLLAMMGGAITVSDEVP